MKRTFALVLLLGLAMGALLTGCNQNSSTTPGTTPSTNSPATNAP